MPRIKVLVTGAGIAGNALAFWLTRLGHEVTVIERFPSLRTTGLQIDLRGHGIEVMKRMGLEQAFRAKAAPEQGIAIIDSSGRRRAFFPANTSGKGAQNFTTEFEIMRGDLCRLLYDASKGRPNFVFGTSVESFEQNDEGVKVRLSDGKTAQYDLIVGADGQWSHTRRLMLGPNVPDKIYPIPGVYVAYFTIPRPIQPNEEYIATSYIAPGRRGLMTRRHNANELQVYLGCTKDSARLKNAKRGDSAEEKAALAEIFVGAGGPTEEILESMKGANDFYCERMALVKLDSWSKGHAVLVGDAAYCPTASTGMGTTSGIVGAYILAGEISRYCGRADGEGARKGHSSNDNLAAALKAYEDKFRPFMQQVQKGVEGNPDWYPSSTFSVGVLNALLGVASFFKVNMGKWMLKETVKDWDLPDYEELLKD